MSASAEMTTTITIIINEKPIGVNDKFFLGKDREGNVQDVF